MKLKSHLFHSQMIKAKITFDTAPAPAPAATFVEEPEEPYQIFWEESFSGE